VTAQKPKQQLVKTTNTCKTKPYKIKPWFRSPFITGLGNGSHLLCCSWRHIDNIHKIFTPWNYTVHSILSLTKQALH